MGLLNRVMHCRNPTFAADLVHHWRETLVPHGGSWFEGDFKAGLNAWQQFLLNGSPGFGVPNRAREYVDAQDRDLIPPEDSNSGQTGDQDANMEAHDEIPRAKIITMRHIPLGALAIVQNHKQRAARMLGEYLDDNEDVDGGEDFFVRDFNTNTQCLLQQDTHLRLPLAANSQEQEPTLVHTHPFYPSPLHALTPRHSTGYFDTFCELDTAALTLWMLDEAVASFRGMPGVRHPANNPDNWTMPNFWQGSAAEGAKGAFHMMSVMEVRGISEDVVRNIREGGRTVLGGGGEESRMLDVERLEGLGEVMGEMFDDWEV